MCLVTLLAVSSGLIGSVRFMALGAIGNFAMLVMAEAAVKCSMFALVVAQLDDLAGMTGHARISYVVTKGNVERCVGVGMTA